MPLNVLVLFVVVITKYLLPLAIIKLPFIAGMANLILDSVDGDILMHFGLSYEKYSLIDKSADWVTYLIMFLVGRRWKIGKTITFLFVYRSVGQFVYLLTRNSMLLFLFPNFLEPLFLIYSYLLFRYKDKAQVKYQKYFYLIWIFIIVFKMWNEYNVHIGHRDLSSIYFGINN